MVTHQHQTGMRYTKKMVGLHLCSKQITPIPSRVRTLAIDNELFLWDCRNCTSELLEHSKFSTSTSFTSSLMYLWNGTSLTLSFFSVVHGQPLWGCWMEYSATQQESRFLPLCTSCSLYLIKLHAHEPNLVHS